MRLLLDLEAKKKQVYPTDYHHKLQGFVYKHIEPFYRELHDKKGYKFFCFSNIFPIGDMEEGDRRKWIISSPDSAMIKWLKENIPEEIHLGEFPRKTGLGRLFLLKRAVGKRCYPLSKTPKGLSGVWELGSKNFYRCSFIVAFQYFVLLSSPKDSYVINCQCKIGSFYYFDNFNGLFDGIFRVIFRNTRISVLELRIISNLRNEL